MSRTWQQNSDAINGLWPHCQWTDEEIDLWRSDLSGLDQDVLFEAVREVKRSRDTLYPQLAWIHDAYRTLRAAQRSAQRLARPAEPAFSGDRLEIDQEESRRLASEIAEEIEAAEPGHVDAIQAKIMASVDRMDASVAARLAWRAGAKRVAAQATAAAETGPSLRIADDREGFEDARAEQLRQLRGAAS